MPDYYHPTITDRSWQILQELARTFTFVLIGGWAVYLYTHSLKSKDIDLVVSLEELSRLKERLGAQKNERLHKYEAIKEEVDIDIYVEHYSNLGMPAEDIREYAIEQEGFLVPRIEVLLFLKQHAWQERRGSAKGRKDEIDIVSLLLHGIEVGAYHDLLKRYGRAELLEELKDLVQTRASFPELNLNQHQYARFKRQFLDQLQKQH